MLWYSLESTQRGDSNEYPQHMFLWRNKQNYPSVTIKYPPYLFFCISHEMVHFLFQTLLSDIDAVLYLDTDNLFLSPVDEIWSFFSMFNSSQLAAVSMEHSDPSIGWYNRFARHPYYGEMGRHRY